jgi:hypothetical protein
MMRWITTFLVNGMQGVIQEEYVYIVDSVETESQSPRKFWLYQSPDIPNIIILNPRRYACDDKVKEVLQNHWAQSNVFVTVKKIASTAFEVHNASK